MNKNYIFLFKNYIIIKYMATYYPIEFLPENKDVIDADPKTRNFFRNNF